MKLATMELPVWQNETTGFVAATVDMSKVCHFQPYGDNKTRVNVAGQLIVVDFTYQEFTKHYNRKIEEFYGSDRPIQPQQHNQQKRR